MQNLFELSHTNENELSNTNKHAHFIQELLKLGVPKHLLQSQYINYEQVHQRLRFAMNNNYFNAPLQCLKEWQLETLGGIEPDYKALKYVVPMDDSLSTIKKNEIKDNWGANPIHYTAWTGDVKSLKGIITELPNVYKKKDNSGRTIFHFAAWSGRKDVFVLLTQDYLSELKKEDNQGRTGFHYALWSGDEETFDFAILNHPKEMKKKDNFGKTPLDYAAWSGNVTILGKLLTKHPKKVKKKDNYGRNQIHLASMSGNPEILTLTKITAPKLLYKQDIYGCTPIHLAVKSGNPEIPVWINNNNAKDFGLKDKKEATPVHYIALLGNPTALNQALSYKENPEKWTLPNAFTKVACKTITKTLIEALKTNYTLTSIVFKDYPISKYAKKSIEISLLRNHAIKETKMQLFALLQGMIPMSDVSFMLNQNIKIFKYLLKYSLPESPQKENIILDISLTKTPFQFFAQKPAQKEVSYPVRDIDSILNFEQDQLDSEKHTI